MSQHALIIHTSYSAGKRIALHKICKSFEDIKEFMVLLSKLKSKFENLTFSYHHIQTESDNVDSISKYDSFFDKIHFYSDLDKFVELVKKDMEIRAMDIAKIILSKGEYSHLELQKLTFLTFCEYFNLYKEELFADDFEAWRHGPVIPELYQCFKDHGDKKIVKYKDSNASAKIYSRLIKIPRYDKLINTIDKTLDMYREDSAWRLVDKTHVPDGPWDTVYKNGNGQNKIIPKDLIKEFIMIDERK